MSHPYAYRTLPMLLFPAALSACGGIDEEACEASKASAYQAWESYRHALEEASDAQRLSAATTIRDSYLHEGYSPVAENALRTSMEVLFTAPGGASEAESSSLGRLVRAVSDPLLADAVDASTEVLGLCRSEGEPWPLGERVQASLNAKPEREAAQERLVRLAAGLEPAAPESLATALSTVGQAIGSCEELAGPNGPFDIVALNMGSEVPSASLSSSLSRSR